MPLITLLIIIIVAVLAMIKQVNEYQRGVLFTMGKYSKRYMPGWKVIIPIFQRLIKVDIRTKAVDVPYQEAITRDNITIRINAVIYYHINDAAKSIIAVESFYYAISQLAQTTMRNVVGEVSLDELLQKRTELSDKIKEIVDEASDPWGIVVESVELKDVVLPENMKRTMAKEAEAEREKRAVIIKADGDRIAADNLALAAEKLNSEPGAMHLRTLQAVNDLSSDQSNTTIWMIPIEVLRGIERVSDKLGIELMEKTGMTNPIIKKATHAKTASHAKASHAAPKAEAEAKPTTPPPAA